MRGNPDGARTETVLMRQKKATELAKQLIMVSKIKSICNNAVHQDPGATLDAIVDVLASKTDSEDEAPSTERRIIFPAEDVAGCEQQ